MCEATVYGLCASKKLRHVRITSGRGRDTIRIDEGDLAAFVPGAAVGAGVRPAPPPRAKVMTLKHLKLF